MEIFHVLNRGVDKRNIVMDDADRLRFMQSLYLYNNKDLVDRNTRRLSKEKMLHHKRKPLVHIHAFCLMDNHYHLILSPLNGDLVHLSAFMRKLNMGYAKYFNEKYKRSGALWQGKYKSIHINNDPQFKYIPYYIHLNPLDIKYPEWRDGGVKKMKGALEFLKAYRWSSFQDYNNMPNYRSILYTTLLSDVLSTSKNQEKNIADIISNHDEMLDSQAIE